LGLELKNKKLARLVNVAMKHKCVWKGKKKQKNDKRTCLS
jgi:hypothetical protein